MTRTLDLTPYCQNDSIVLSGRPQGVEARKHFSLDQLDASNDDAVVVVPQRVISFNGSFFLGLFAPSIKRLGVVKFEDKYRFNCRPELAADIDRGKREALNESNPLQPNS